jgi:hypothetical protein
MECAMYKAEEKKMKQALKKMGREVPDLVMLDAWETDLIPYGNFMQCICWTNSRLTDFYLYVFSNPVKKDGTFAYVEEKDSIECLHFMSLNKLTRYVSENQDFEQTLMVARQAVIQKNYEDLQQKINANLPLVDKEAERENKSGFKI